MNTASQKYIASHTVYIFWAQPVEFYPTYKWKKYSTHTPLRTINLNYSLYVSHTVNSETAVRPNNDYYFPSGLPTSKTGNAGTIIKGHVK